MEKIYNVTEFAEMVSKSVKTLQKWDREGTLTAYRSPSNRRYYTHHQYLEYISGSGNTDKVNVIYARVYSRSQKNELKNQINYLEKYSLNEGIRINKVYSDYGSSLNYKRENWNTLIDDCFHKKISKIIISHNDRFVRFGFHWLSDLLFRFTGTEIIVAENIATSPKGEMVKDLISIIHAFSYRVCELSKFKKRLEKEKMDD